MRMNVPDSRAAQHDTAGPCHSSDNVVPERSNGFVSSPFVEQIVRQLFHRLVGGENHSLAFGTGDHQRVGRHFHHVSFVGFIIDHDYIGTGYKRFGFEHGLADGRSGHVDGVVVVIDAVVGIARAFQQGPGGITDRAPAAGADVVAIPGLGDIVFFAETGVVVLTIAAGHIPADQPKDGFVIGRRSDVGHIIDEKEHVLRQDL